MKPGYRLTRRGERVMFALAVLALGSFCAMVSLVLAAYIALGRG